MPTKATPLNPIIGGRYRISGINGRGSNGIELKAEHLGTGTPIALRIVRIGDPKHPDISRAIRRFQGELQRLEKVQSPSILKIEDHGIGTDYVWTASALEEGKTLRQALAEGFRPDTAIAGRLAHDALEALTQAHAAGVTHGSITASELLLTGPHWKKPRIKITGFGAASIIRETGTPQGFRPATREAEKRHDLQCLGKALRELTEAIEDDKKECARLAGKVPLAQVIATTLEKAGEDAKFTPPRIRPSLLRKARPFLLGVSSYVVLGLIITSILTVPSKDVRITPPSTPSTPFVPFAQLQQAANPLRKTAEEPARKDEEDFGIKHIPSEVAQNNQQKSDPPDSAEMEKKAATTSKETEDGLSSIDDLMVALFTDPHHWLEKNDEPYNSDKPKQSAPEESGEELDFAKDQRIAPINLPSETESKIPEIKPEEQSIGTETVEDTRRSSGTETPPGIEKPKSEETAEDHTKNSPNSVIPAADQPTGQSDYQIMPPLSCETSIIGRTGNHLDFGRVVFEFPAIPTFSYYSVGQRIIIFFDNAACISQALPIPKNIRSIRTYTGVAMIQPYENATIRIFRLDRRIVIDAHSNN